MERWCANKQTLMGFKNVAILALRKKPNILDFDRQTPARPYLTFDGVWLLTQADFLTL